MCGAMTKFKIIIPAYNCVNTLPKSMQILSAQTYANWQAIIINDASTDNTGAIAKTHAEADPKFRILNNPKNVGVGQNIITGIKMLCDRPDDVIVIVDGDDRLLDNTVLEAVDRVYENPNVWITYGQYITSKHLADGQMIPGGNKPIKDFSQTRQPLFNFSHLKTFKYHLWEHLDDADLRGKDGQYIKAAFDVALMVPMIEMAGPEHTKFIETILYVYNMDNTTHEFIKRPQLQEQENLYIRRKPRKALLS